MIFTILAIYGIAYAFRNLNGPWNILGKLRIFLLKSPQFYELLNCPFCCGFWAGWIAFFLTTEEFNVATILLYAFAGSVIVPVGDAILGRLEK